MKRFDYESVLNKQKKGLNRSLILLIVLSIVFVTTFTLGIIFSTYENKVLFMLLFSIALAFLITLILIILIFGVIEHKRQIKQIHYILGGYLTIIEGKITNINDVITTISGRKGKEIVVEDKDDISSIYLDSCIKDTPFYVGDLVKVKVSEGFIIEYEVLHE